MTGNGRLKSVLVVNDEPFIRRILSRMVAREGYSVAEASDGQDALNHLKKEPVDFVISDLEMPKMDGRQLLTRVKELYPNTKVLFVTAQGARRITVEAGKADADDYITKPFKNMEIAKTLSNLSIKRSRPMKSRSD
jgi:CheY-like chemotaxis protein